MRKYVNDLRTFPVDAAGAWRANGAPGLWNEVRRRTVDRAGGFVSYLVLEADLTEFRPASAPRGIDIRPFAGPDWSALGDLASCRVAPIFDAAIRAGRICLVAWRGAEAVGYIWFSPAIEERHENFSLTLPSDTNYLWQLQVARSARRQGLGAALVSAGLRSALASGVRCSWMITHPDNTAAQNTLASVAATRVLGTVKRVKLASWMHSRYSPLDQPLPLQPVRRA